MSNLRMKLKLILLFSALIIVAGLTDSAQGHQKRKHKKFGGRHHRVRSSAESNDEEAEIITMLERDEAAENRRNPEKEALIENSVFTIDPCYQKHCDPGKICKISESGRPECVCIGGCPEESDPRRKVCSNHNETWNSDCALHQMRCWCQYNDNRCLREELYHVHIEYYGNCKKMEECTADQMADFPRRMRDWLFNIMHDLADREELSPYYLKMEREAEMNLTKRWANAAVWKWCDLERNHDRSVSRHELFPIRAPILAMEHCIAPFLDSCDVDNTHSITLSEWAKCLELDEDEIEERCEDIRDDGDD